MINWLVLPDKSHADVILVVFRIVRVSRIDSTGHEDPVQQRLVLGQRLRGDLDAAEQPVTVFFLGIACQGQEPAEQGQVPEVDEGHGDAGVEAEDPDAGKRGHDSGQEAAEVGEWRHCDGDGRVAEAETHPLGHRQLVGGDASPGAEQDVGVVQADAEQQEGGRHVEADELDLRVAAEPKAGDLVKGKKIWRHWDDILNPRGPVALIKCVFLQIELYFWAWVLFLPLLRCLIHLLSTW